MRLLATTPGEQEAARFGDYLTTVGIGNQVESGSQGWMIWVEHDDDLERAKQEWGRFQQNPNDAHYQLAGSTAKKHRAKQEKAEKRRRKNFVDVRTSWAKQSWSTPPLTLTLIVITLIVAGLTGIGYWTDSPAMQWLRFAYPSPQRVHDHLQQIAREQLQNPNAMQHWLGPWADIRHGQVWRLVTPIFIHFGVIHLVFNLFWFRDLGSLIERRKGWLMLLTLVFTGAVIPNVCQVFASGPNFGGLSGVVYALFGYIWMKERYEPWENLGLLPGTVSTMLIWLVVCFTGVFGPVANTAHVVGLAVGMVFGGARGFIDRARRRMRFR